MYFPEGFDLERAIELCELTDQAYSQFEAFLRGNTWKPADAYTLRKELCGTAPAGRNTVAIRGLFDDDLRGMRRAGGKDPQAVPIGFIARRKENIFLIFRGTVTDQEWFQNLRIRLVPFLLPNFGKVHDGFLQTYNLFRTEIQETLEKTDRSSRLFIAGHSLGGALATIALPDIGARTGRKDISLYTYGSPRIGDNGFVTAFNNRYFEKSFRIVNTSDLVDLIPPPVPIAGSLGGYFSHVETPVGFTLQFEDVLKNHDIRTYLSALQDSKAKQGILNRLKNWFARRRAA